jgi:hypothetical protein
MVVIYYNINIIYNGIQPKRRIRKRKKRYQVKVKFIGKKYQVKVKFIGKIRKTTNISN